MLDLESRFEQLVEEKAGIHDLREFVRQLVRELDGFRNEIKEEVTVRSRSASLDMTKTLAAEVCAEHTKEIEDLKKQLQEERERGKEMEDKFDNWQHEICQQQITEIDRIQEQREKDSMEQEMKILDLEGHYMAQQRKIAQLEDEVAEVTETLRYTQEKLENNEAMSQKQLERERGRWDEERKMAMEEVVQVTQRRIHLMSEMELLEEENSRLQRRCADDTESNMELQWENDKLRREVERLEEEKRKASLRPLPVIRPRKSSLSIHSTGNSSTDLAQSILTKLDDDLNNGGTVPEKDALEQDRGPEGKEKKGMAESVDIKVGEEEDGSELEPVIIHERVDSGMGLDISK